MVCEDTNHGWRKFRLKRNLFHGLCLHKTCIFQYHTDSSQNNPLPWFVSPQNMYISISYPIPIMLKERKSSSMVCVSTKHAYFNIILTRPKITVHRWFVRSQTTGGEASASIFFHGLCLHKTCIFQYHTLSQ